MTSDPRAALDRLIAAFEAHLQASVVRRSDTDPAVESSYVELTDAFELYDEALYRSYGETTPFLLYDDVADEADDDDYVDDETGDDGEGSEEYDDEFIDDGLPEEFDDEDEDENDEDDADDEEDVDELAELFDDEDDASPA